MEKSDEKQLKSDYCAGLLSIQKVADKHGIPKSTLLDLAKKNKWERRKTPSKNSVQKSNGRTVGNENNGRKNTGEKTGDISTRSDPSKNESYRFDPSQFGLSEMQALFCENVAAGKNLIEAYRLAGYSAVGNSGYAAASQLFRNIKVGRAIRFLRDGRQRRLALIEEDIIHQLVSIASADPNELSQLRRVNCRFCWGEDHLYQWRDMEEFNRAAAKAVKDGMRDPDFGGVGFVDSAVPNPDCQKCGGEGTQNTFFSDTTMIDGPARWLFAGVKETMNGFEVKMSSQDNARRELIKLVALREQSSHRQELELERLRLANEKTKAEIEKIRADGNGGSETVIVHNSLKVPGAVQQEGDE